MSVIILIIAFVLFAVAIIIYFHLYNYCMERRETKKEKQLDKAYDKKHKSDWIVYGFEQQ